MRHLHRDYDDVTWGDQLCLASNCMRVADVLLDGVPCCIPCADDVIERWIAVTMLPAIAQSLPPLFNA